MTKPLARRIAYGLFILFFLLVITFLADFFLHRRIPSRGGLYFPKRVLLDLPHYAQGDPEWKDDLLGATDETLHAVGCAVTSASMVLGFYGIDAPPGKLNAFLTDHPQGYTPEGWIYWEAAADYTPGIIEKAYEDAPSYARIDGNLLKGNPVIVRVKLPSNTHFVVIVGKEGFDYLALDPGTYAHEGPVPLQKIASHIEALRYYRRLPQSALKETLNQ